MIRELVLDTETTGLSPEKGDKIVEIGIVELINHIPTKNFFHNYLNPKRLVPETAFKVHGLSYEFLKDKPLFSEIAYEMLNFIGDDPIIIHNAPFDLGFLNNELSTINYREINSSQVIDTLILARQKYPGSPASLDALCRRFSINNVNRNLHGALLDSHILAKVYLELIGGNQPNLQFIETQSFNNKVSKTNNKTTPNKPFRPINSSDRLTDEERKKHKDYISKLNGLSKWSLYN